MEIVGKRNRQSSLVDRSAALLLVLLASIASGAVIAQWEASDLTLLSALSALVIASTAVVLLFVRPVDFFLVFCALIFSVQYLEKLHFGSVGALDLIGGILPLLFLARGVLFSKSSFRLENVEKAYLAFLIALIPALLKGSVLLHTEDALTWWIKVFNGFAILVYSRNLFGAGLNVRKMTKMLVMGISVPAGIGIWQFITGQWAYIKRGLPFVNGGFHHPGELAYDLFFATTLALFLSTCEDSRRSRRSWRIAAALLGILTLLTFRRNVWIGSFVFFLAWTTLAKRWKLVPILVAGSIAAFQIPAVQTSLADFSVVIPNSNIPYEATFSGRLTVFSAVIKGYLSGSWADKLLGFGLNASPFIVYEQIGIESGGHNNYLLILADGGALGLLLYLILWMGVLALGLKLWKTHNVLTSNWGKLLVSLWASYSIMGLATHLIFRLVTGEWIFWTVVGIALGMHRATRMIGKGNQWRL